MEKDKKELNLNEMEKVSGGLRTEYLNAEELATYLKLKEAGCQGDAMNPGPQTSGLTNRNHMEGFV